MICTAAITTSQFITRSQCLEEFWKLPAGFVARWSCWQYQLHAESWKNEVMAKGRILTPEGFFFFPFEAKMLSPDHFAEWALKNFQLLGLGNGIYGAWFSSSLKLVPLSTHGWDRTLPWHTLNLPCKKTVYHLLLPLPGCKMGPWAGSSWVQFPSAELCLGSEQQRAHGDKASGQGLGRWAQSPPNIWGCWACGSRTGCVFRSGRMAAIPSDGMR